ncbi:MAG: SGNH/GDSL hydrolase family protein [Candidatus Woesearchaeota archaeon]
MIYSINVGRELSEITFTPTIEVGEITNDSFQFMLLGDSIAAGVGADNLSKSVYGRILEYVNSNNEKNMSMRFENRAISGNKIEDVVEDLKNMDKEDIYLLVIIVSSNDVFQFTPLHSFENSIDELIEFSTNISENIIFIGPGKVYDVSGISLLLKPLYWLRARQISNVLEEKFEQYEQVTYINPIRENLEEFNSIDLESKDNIHPNNKGHIYWFELFRRGIEAE